MFVNDQSVLINEITGRYPMSLQDVRAEIHLVSLSREPNCEKLEAMGYFVVEPTERPSGYYEEGEPYKTEDKYYQTWVPSDYSDEEDLAEERDRRILQLDQLKSRMVERGYLVSETPRLHIPLDVQTRGYLQEMFIRLDSAHLQDDTIHIPTMETVYEDYSHTDAFVLLEAVLSYHHELNQCHLELLKQLTTASSFDDLPEIYDTSIDNLLSSRKLQDA